MRTVVVTRYVAPLREGGSLPALVEGDDTGLCEDPAQALEHLLDRMVRSPAT